MSRDTCRKWGVSRVPSLCRLSRFLLVGIGGSGLAGHNVPRIMGGGFLREVRVLEKNVELPEHSPAKVTYMGNVTLITTFQKQPGAPPVRKVDADHYEDLRTGEVFEYEHIEDRSECHQSIQRTLAYIRALINVNVTVPKNCRWVTLTYAENMRDTERLYSDFKKFWQKFCRYCAANGIGKPEYICVIEPQGRGAWHIHAFFIWDSPAPFIDNNSVLEVLWPHGFTKISAVSNCDNVGAYFSAYLADMPLEDLERLPKAEQEQALKAGCRVLHKEFTDGNGHTKSKKFVKGGRLYLYPPKMQIIRKSKGIKKPFSEQMTAQEAKKKVSSAKLTFSRTYEVVSETSSGYAGTGGATDVPKSVNIIRKDYYNSKRK